MKRIQRICIFLALLLLALGCLACTPQNTALRPTAAPSFANDLWTAPPPEATAVPAAEPIASPTPAEQPTSDPTAAPTQAATAAPTAEPTAAPTPTPKPTKTPKPKPTPTPKPTKTPRPTATPAAIDENGVYDDRDSVALYLHVYGHLPSNYMTKREAEAEGWTGGALSSYLPGKCIGGDRFGNYEKLLPTKKGRTYYECDIGTMGRSSRGAKRIIYSNDGLIYYTDDHYDSFTLLYGNP